MHDGEAEIRSAEHLWGKVTDVAETMIREELEDDKIEIAQIGPAGENLVRYAAIMNMSNRANGRTGMGAVMGSKNLKAVAVQGTDRPELADRSNVIELAKWGSSNLEESGVYGLALFGTANVMSYQNKKGGQVTYNWDSGYFETADVLDGKTWAKTILKSRDTCYACTVKCKRVVEVTEGPYRAEPKYGGPEYETLSTFGTYCAIDDLEAISHANQLCNMYGMDTISCGATIAWAMNCFEEGLLSLEDTGGVDLRYGNAEAMVQMTEMIGKSEGFGAGRNRQEARSAGAHASFQAKPRIDIRRESIRSRPPVVRTRYSMAALYGSNVRDRRYQ
jgi:aldehyde:ferredoxin oxidoreductase